MQIDNAAQEDWELLSTFFPVGWRDLAKTTGALKGLRRDKGEENYLRVMMMHFGCGLSMVETVTRAKRAQDKILRLSHQAEAIVASSMSVEALLPELVAASAGMDAAQSQDVFGPGLAPEHARLFAARADHGFAASLNDPGTDEQALPTKGPVLHSLYIVNEVAQFLVNLLSLRLAGAFLAGFLNEVFDPIAQ